MFMAISRTPYRVSFFGGGTDYPEWYLKNGGAVISMAINRYCYIVGRHLPPFFGIRHRVVWSHIETVNAISEILHPAVRAGLETMGYSDEQGVEIHHQGDLPARSGIGSSSAFAVGLINVLHAMRGSSLNRRDLANAAIRLERETLNETVGCQDQVASAYGGLNVIRFGTDGAIDVLPLDLSGESQSKLENWLMLFYSGTTRLSSALSKQLVSNFDRNAEHLGRMHAMVDQGTKLLRQGQMEDFGRLLDESWRLKRGLAENVSTAGIDKVYEDAIAAGALGGKLLGAGGAGFMAFIVPPERQAAVRASLAHLLYVPAGIDFTGSTIVYRQQESVSGPKP
jgi:D-glycero-alpha-D-manno-heptose-7-phosphate kinase